MRLVPYGLSPDELWELDFASARARREIGVLRAAAKSLRERAKPGEPVVGADQLEQSATAIEAELVGYAPGSGPVFTIGSIPNGMRAEIAGAYQEIGKLPEGVERMKRDAAWAEMVIRWAVRGHRNLRQRNGAEIPYKAESITWEGRTRTAPSRETLEAYGPILSDLALLALASQQLDEAGKNG